MTTRQQAEVAAAQAILNGKEPDVALLSVANVARALGKQSQTLYRWMRAGKFPSCVGETKQILARDFAAWVEQSRRPFQAPPKAGVFRRVRR